MVVRASACRAAICTSRRSTPTSSMVVTKECRSMCGCIRGSLTPACSATRRSRRVAQCRSIRVPLQVRRMGPGGPFVDGPLDGAADGRGKRDQYDLVALAPNAPYTVAVLLAEVFDVAAGGLEGPQAQEPQHRD